MSIYSILGIATGIVVMYLLYKSDAIKENQKNYMSSNEEDETDLIEKPTAIGKNKWLHTTDDFGKMEEGVADYETREKYKRRHI